METTLEFSTSQTRRPREPKLGQKHSPIVPSDKVQRECHKERNKSPKIIFPRTPSDEVQGVSTR